MHSRFPVGLPNKEKNSKLGNNEIYPVFPFLQMRQFRFRAFSCFFGKASVNPGKQEILFEQRNARKDTKKFHGSGFFCENKPYFP
jgi:hypothetical protein